jgi:hypothetical protein
VVVLLVQGLQPDLTLDGLEIDLGPGFGRSGLDMSSS